MSLASIAGEAVRNVRAGVGGSGLLLIVVIVLTACGVLVPQCALIHADGRAVSYRESGAATLIIRAEGRVDGIRCEAFNGVDNVVAAGAVRERSSIALTLLPSTAVRYFEGTPQFAGVLGARVSGAGVLLSDEVAEAIGWREGDPVSIRERNRVPVGGRFAYPDDGRVTGFGFSIVGETPARGGLFDECWVTVWPQTGVIEALSGIVVTSAGAGSGAGPTLMQANPTLGARFSASTERTLWSFAGLASAVLIGGVVALHVRGRRLELASARHVGLRASDQYGVVLIEVGIVASVAVIVALPVAVYLVVTAPSIAVPLAWHGLRGAALSFAGAICGAAIGLAGLRERHLFRYFRER